MALRLGNSVLADFVEQGFVADLEKAGGLLAVPVGLFQSLSDGLRLGFIFGGSCQGFQASAGLSSARRGVARYSTGAVVSGQQFGNGEFLIPENQIALEEVIQLP